MFIYSFFIFFSFCFLLFFHSPVWLEFVWLLVEMVDWQQCEWEWYCLFTPPSMMKSCWRSSKAIDSKQWCSFIFFTFILFFFLLCFVCLCILCSIQYSNLSELAAEKPKWGPIHYIANNNNHKKKTERMMIYKHTWYSTNILGQALTALAVVRHTTDVCFGSNGAARNVDTFTYHACMACRGYITIYERSI